MGKQQSHIPSTTRIVRQVDTVTPQPGDLLLNPATRDGHINIPTDLMPFCQAADLPACGLTDSDFGQILSTLGNRLHYGLPAGTDPTRAQQLTFFRALHLTELALAQACALGRDRAWERFLILYREPVTAVAIAIAGNATAGHELADSLYSELFGLTAREGVRRSPLASYSGRGSLLGWLRTTLAQRHVDRFRRTRREVPLEDFDAPVPASANQPNPAAEQLRNAVGSTLEALPPDDRFLLATYFLDRQTLLVIARMLGVHEATISRRLKRLLTDLRKRLLLNLQATGLSRRAAEEALGTDPRDLEFNEINLRQLLQVSQRPPFSAQESNRAGPAPAPAPGPSPDSTS